MSNIKTKQLQILTDIQLVWDFMVDIYEPHCANGAAAPYFEYAITSTWMDKAYLHLDRFWMDGDRVVGFVFTESSPTNIHFSLRPGYEELADEMMEYADRSFPDFGDGRELTLFPGQEALIKAAKKCGYQMVYDNVDLLFDFKKSKLSYELPDGFRFVDLSKIDTSKIDTLKLAKCIWGGFNEEELGPFENGDRRNPEMPWDPYRAYNGIVSSTIAPPPHSTYEYNVIIENKQGDYVCFSGMWWVAQNKLAYMEPLCTVPQYRKMGLAAAALTQHYRRLKELGAEYMTGGGNDFYRKIGYGDEIHWTHWRK